MGQKALMKALSIIDDLMSYILSYNTQELCDILTVVGVSESRETMRFQEIEINTLSAY